MVWSMLKQSARREVLLYTHAVDLTFFIGRTCKDGPFFFADRYAYYFVGIWKLTMPAYLRNDHARVMVSEYSCLRQIPRSSGLRFIYCCYNRLCVIIAHNKPSLHTTHLSTSSARGVMLILDTYGDTGSLLTNYDKDVWHGNAVRTREQITQLIILRSYSSAFSTLSGRADSSTL